ncbi:MAG: sulfatase-like hydrolase/transferase [Bacteroidota bacterium]
MKPFSLSLWCVLAVLLSCQPPAPAESLAPPNIIWLVAEDISPALGAYGDALAKTPNLDRLAEQSVIFDQAYATAPICAPARTCLITGLYATSLGSQHLRCEITLPEEVQPFPYYLQEAGYYVTNRNKTDYNFSPDGIWDHWSGSYAPWRNREGDQPFFSFINVDPTHEGMANRSERLQPVIADLPPELRQNPDDMTVPPFYPDTPESREVWANYYELISVMDQNVGNLLDSLEADGLMDETIILFLGDHGFGMPRFKRWLYRTGLQVPMIAYVPEAYREAFGLEAGSHSDRLVSFVDMAPTALHLAGVEIPATMEGQPFLGNNLPVKRDYVFAARDRADDMYEMSRAVLDDRYLYVRNYLPHYAYMQPGFIYSDVKRGFRILRALHESGEGNAAQESLWQTKPAEELYDLENDPWELNNLADDPAYADKKDLLRTQLHQWMLSTHDLGLLPEAEYLIRSADSSPYAYARTDADYAVGELLAAAEMVGIDEETELLPLLESEDSGVRFWGVIGMMQLEAWSASGKQALTELLRDASPSVQIQAAEALLSRGNSPQAVEVLGTWMQDERHWLALQAARSALLVGEVTRPLIPTMYAVHESLLAEPGGRLRYLDFNFAAFTAWSLEWALQELGEDVTVNGA